MAIAAALLVAPVSAQAMTVDQFLTKVAALKKKGIFALGSPDIGLLKAEMAGVTRDWQTDQQEAKKAGRPLACNDTGKHMTQKEFLTALAGIPPAQRGASMKTAFYAIVKQKYPCPV